MAGRYAKAREGKPVVVKGVPIPFTFWPDAYVERGRIVTSDPWPCLLAYVRQNVKDQSRRRRAIAFLEQAQDFYQSAAAPRIGVRPLLYYYSFMNLAKAFLAVHTRCDLTRCIHGLHETADSIRIRLTITSQSVKVDRTGGARLQLYREFITACAFPPPAEPDPTRVVDLLEQIVGIHRITSHTLGRSAQFFPVKDIMFECDPAKKEAWIALHLNREEVKQAASDIRRHTTTFSEVEWHDKSVRRFESQAMSYGKTPLQVLRQLVLSVWKDIWSALRPGGYRFWVTSIPQDKRRAQLASGYQAMFYFGSISRYRPDDFQKLAEGRHGWMVQEFINTQPIQFVYFLGSGIMEAEMVVPELF